MAIASLFLSPSLILSLFPSHRFVIVIIGSLRVSLNHVVGTWLKSYTQKLIDLTYLRSIQSAETFRERDCSRQHGSHLSLSDSRRLPSASFALVAPTSRAWRFPRVNTTQRSTAGHADSRMWPIRSNDKSRRAAPNRHTVFAPVESVEEK